MKNIRLKEFNSKMIKKYNKQLKLYLKIVLDENKILNNDEKLGKIIEEMKQFIEDKSAIIIGAFKEEELIGFIWGYKIIVNDKNRLHINYFIVNEKYRKQGIGTQLIEKIYEIANEIQIKEIELMVTSKNIIAVNFYKDQGFEVERIKLCKKI